MGVYEFIVDLHKRGGSIINQYVVRGGSHLIYTEPDSTEEKEIFLSRA